MNAPDVQPTRLRTAIALSIAGHVCALLLLAALLDGHSVTLSNEPEPGPVLYLTSSVHRVAFRPLRAAPPSAAPRPLRVEPPRATSAPRPSAVRTASPPHTYAASAVSTRARQTTAFVTGTEDAPRAPTRATLAMIAAPTPTPMPTAAPETPSPPAPTPVITATPAAVAQANFGGLFSQNYPPALAAPTDLAAIRSHLAGPVRIRIDVDETGRATSVRFERPVADEALADAVRSQLLALRYVPADCNGLHCEGSMEIIY